MIDNRWRYRMLRRIFALESYAPLTRSAARRDMNDAGLNRMA